MPTSVFRRELARRNPSTTSARRWLFVSYDQLSDEVGPLSREPPSELGILLVECPEKAARRPYHQQKLALLLTNLRHFALEQAERGVAVRHIVAASYAEGIRAVARDVGALRMMRAAERELRVELAPLLADQTLQEIPNEGWLTTTEDFDASQHEPPWRMDAFYRHVRRKLGVLMAAGKPIGGRFSFDTENRRAWHGKPRAPSPPLFEPDAITREVVELVATKMSHHPGALQPELLPATRDDAARVWSWAKSECLPFFGPYEDAMSSASRSLFHTRISALLNMQRLSAARVLRDVAEDRALPVPSKEGFVRQVLGWREYMRHVHEATDGFRMLHGERQPSADAPGDGGFARWSGDPWTQGQGGDGGSLASLLNAANPLPSAYWGRRSGLHCLDHVVEAVWQDGYGHHITRLMVLSNIAMLLDVSPRELTDWFWAAYVDAYDWVVEPNVHGMGTFGVADLLTTKPYIAGSAYIHKMSDFCSSCRFDPKRTCPLTPMYWAYLARHREVLHGVPRMRLPLVAEARRSNEQRAADASVYESVSRALSQGDELAR